MAESAFAQHVVSSIRKELDLLKTHNYLQPHAYDEILRLLPSNIGSRGDILSNGYPASATNQSYGNMPNPSPAQSHTSMPGTPATVVPPPAYNASANENKLGTAEALYDYTGENPSTDLSFRRGDTIQLTELVNDDWWKGSLHGHTGIFPRNYVKRNEPAVREKMSSPPPPPTRQSERDSYGYSSVPPKQDAYSYPPPPQQQNSTYGNPYPPPAAQQQSYQAPPPQQSYPAPPPQQSYPAPPQQVASYSAPPPLTSTSSAPAVVEQPHEESKVASFGKKFAGNIANAATFGFGSTLGSQAAHSIF